MATSKNNPTQGKGSGFRLKESAITLRPSQGWSAEPETIKRVQECADLIVNGASRASVNQFLADKYGVKDRQQRAYYMAAIRYLQPDDEDEFRKAMLQANIERLETIVERTLAGEDYKNAIAAIKEINNVLNPSKSSIEVTTKDTEFKISFD